jgi:tetratricopeptide (TPR) repeat protein
MSKVDLRSAASLLERGDYDAARSSLERLIQINHCHAAAHALLAKIAEAQLRFSDAIVHWEDAYSINPMSTEIALSFESATLRLLLPKPSEDPERHIRFVPPIEHIEPASEDSSSDTSDEIVQELSARVDHVAEKEAQEAAALEAAAKDAAAKDAAKKEIAAKNVLTHPPGKADEDDLTKLIEELDSARIVPDPDINLISDADLAVEIEDVVSETLARIYASQNYFDEAGEVYLKLAIQYPDRKSEFIAKADGMKSRAMARN